MRTGNANRRTKETEIEIKINLDGTGNSSVETPNGFLNHMLEAFSKHSLVDLTIQATGDIEVDQHHLIEDLGYVLGLALKDALGKNQGINRAGYFIYPMDEALALCAVDLSGRPYVQFKGEFMYQYCGQFETVLVKHFFEALARGLLANIAIRLLAGENDHHKIEAIFKAFAKSMKQAITSEPRLAGAVPSTKGVIDQ